MVSFYFLGSAAPVRVSVAGVSSGDHSRNFFDDDGRRIFSNENGNA